MTVSMLEEYVSIYFTYSYIAYTLSHIIRVPSFKKMARSQDLKFTHAQVYYTGFLRSCNSGPEAIPRMREYKRVVQRIAEFLQL